MPDSNHVSRRCVLLSALAALSAAAARPAIGGRLQTQGCFIAPEEFRNLTVYNKPPASSKGDVRDIPIIGSSRDDTFDKALGRVLVKLSGEFGVAPGFGYYDDSSGFNALATPLTRIPETEGTVLFGMGMLNKLMAGDDGDIAVLAVCAHEFGHIVQYQTREKDRIESRLPGYCVELHADFLAGYFLRLFRMERPNIGVQGVGQAWEGLGSSDFNHPGTHGTSRQRVTAIESGYFHAEEAGRGLDRALSEAFGHVSRYG